MDGVGEWSTTCIGVGQGNRIELTHEMRFPHSLGLLYSAFTQYTGFRVNSGEYKLMGLAPYGEPIYRELILDRLIDLKDDGSFRMDMRYFNYCHGLTMTSRAFHKLFGGPPRAMESPIRQRDMDLAASIQAVAEEIILRMARHAHAQTGQRKLVMAGGVALNCVANGRILREGPFEDIWIQPAAGDAGGALGIALFIWHQLLGRPRQVTGEDSQRASLLGPSYSDEAIADLLRMKGEAFTAFTTEDELCRHVAESLAQGKVVGWFQGRMEFGPRALGSRSILGDPRSASMRSVMNQKIKFRESFRPFAPIVTRESASEYFELSPRHDSPYMLIVDPVRENQRLELDDAARSARGLDKLKHPRSRLPAITHVDDSARVQTVDRTRNPLLHRLLLAFRERTGCAVLINTSFNVRGEPIVCTPDDALRCFHATDIEVLVLGRSVLKKEVRFESGSGEARRRHLAAFPLD